MSLIRWFTRAVRRTHRRPPVAILRPRLLALEDRLTPATLDVLAGGNLVYTGANVNNALAVSLAAGNYTFSDPLDPITLGAGAVTAGFTTSGGGATATGPSAGINSIAISVGTATNDVMLGTFDATLPALDVSTGSIGASTLSTVGTLIDSGPVSLRGFGEITLGGMVSAAGDITIRGDNIDVQQAIATPGRATFTTATVGQQIDLGGPDTPGALGLTESELQLVTAGTLAIGDSQAGAISVSSNITQAGSGFSVLLLTTGGSISSAGGSIAVSDLGLKSQTGINLQTSVTNLAFANTVSGAVVIANSGGLTLTPVGGIAVSQNGGTTIDVTTTGGLLVSESVQGVGTITLTSTDAAGAGQDLQVGAAISVISNTGDVNLRAGDNLALAANSHVQAAGTVALAIDFGNADAGVGASAIVPGSALFAPTATLAGNADDDAFNVSGGASAPLSVNGAAGTNTLNFDALAQAVQITATTITASGLQPVTYASVATIHVANATAVSVVGTGADDVFTIARGASGVQVTLNGGPVITIGDVPLTLDGAGGANTLIYDFGGGSPIPTGGLTLNNFSKYQVNGTAGNDVFDLQAAGGVSQFRINGGTFINLPGAQSFEVDGLAGNDTLHVSYAGGDPVPGGGVTFDGGPGSDALGVIGAGNTATYRPSATTAGNGTVTVDAGTITFLNLTPIDITGMALATIVLPNADDVLALDNGFDFTMGGATPALRVSGTSGGVGIETAAFFNNTTVLIDTTANDGNDTISVNSATVGNNQNLTINTGVGTDSVTVNAGPGISVPGQLTIASVAINLNGPIASTGAGGGITLTNSGTLTIGGVTVSSQGPILQNGAGSVAITGNANLSTNSGAITIQSAVTFTAGVTASFISTGSGAISFGSTLDGGGDVTITTAGLTTLSGAVGGGTALASLTTNGGGTTAINGGLVRTTGLQQYTDNVTVGAAATQFTSTGNADITFSGTLNGASNVFVTTGGTTTFIGAIGGATALSSLTTDGGGTTAINGGLVRTTGVQQYSDAVTVGAAATQFTSTGNAAINFGNTLDGASAVTVATGGLTTFTGAVGGGTALSSLTTNGGGTTAVNGGLVRTTGAQLFSDDVTVGGAATLFTSTGNATITFAGTLDGASAVTVTTGGLTTFTGAVGGGTALTSLTTNGGGTTDVNGGLVRTTGAQQYDDAVTLSAPVTQFTSTGNAAITFGSTLDGASATTITTGGLTTFGGAVGGTTALISLTTDGGGTTAVNGGLVRTTGAQLFSDDVTVSGAATLFTSTGNAAITFGGTLDGASDVTVTTGGLTTFAGAVGGTTPLTSLTTNGGGTTAVNGGLVRTTGAQLYSDAVTVSGPATQFTSTGGGAITFSSTLDGASAVTITSSGTVTFLGLVGNGTPLSSLTIDGGGTADLNGGTITTAGSQTYSEPVILSLDTVLNATNVTFAQTVNSDATARSLTVNASGTTIFGGAVGNTSPLFSLTTDAPGSTQINGGSVRTTGSQIYRDAVTLSAGSAGATTTTLTANAAAPGGITFGGTLNGATARNQSLILTANAGDINFNGAVGGTVELGPVTINSARNVTIAAPFTASAIWQAAGTGTTAFNGATTLSAINAIDITTAAISLNANLTAGTSGATVRFNPTAAGVAQAAGTLLVGAVVTPASGRDGVLLLNGSGGFSLNMATNDMGSLTATVNGFVTVRDANDLTIAAPGIHTNNNAITLTTGRNFTATNNNFAVPFLDAGAAPIQVNPGTAAGATITLNAEVRGSTVTLGTDVGALLSNPFPDLFVIRPSRNVQITVKGNRPSPTLGDPIPPGDRLSPIFTGIVGRIVLTPTGLGQGFYSFPDDTVKNLRFFEIENLVGFSTSAYSVQTGPTTYGIRTVNQQLGQTIQGGVSGGQVPSNPFVVAPAIVNPFGPFGAPRIAFGDINGDGTPDLIIGNGPNNPPLVTVINGTALLSINNVSLSDPANILAQFYAYDPSYPGGVFVSAGDFNGDGRAEIVTGTDVGGGPIVRVLEYVQAGDPGFVPGVTTIYTNVRDFNPPGTHIPAMFNAYDPNFRGGVRVAVGDVNGDGKPDIVTGAGPGGGPHVKVFSGADGSVIRSFFAYSANFTGGVFVGAGDYNQDGKADILTGAGNGGSPHVEVFSGASVSPTLLASFFALPPGGNPGFIPDPNSTTGVGSVAFTDANGDGQLDILVGTARGPQARALVFKGPGFTPLLDPGSELLISPTLRDGANVAGSATAISGP